jgi:DNA-binding beta-propeller fold protein YncE
MLALLILLALISQFNARGQVKKEFLFKFGDLNYPRGISVSPTGEIYIADTGNNSVKRFSADGKLISEVKGYGWGELEFDQPYDVDVGSGILVYVADYNNHRIQRFDKNLNFIATFRGESGGEVIFGFPRSVAVSKFGELFIVDGENLRCVKINKFNRFERSFGGIETGRTRLINPSQVSVSPQNLIVVLDVNRVLIFDYYGNFLKEFGSGYLKKATGLFADSLVYVADGNSVLIFDYDGRLIGEISFDEVIFDIAYRNTFLYCLSEESVLVYKLIFSKDE